MACPCIKTNTCSCANAGECKCGADCACENCKAKQEHKDTCACKASGKGTARI
ncbi:hypothetical protein PS15m_000038 [Mucor circinelloides]